MVETINKLSDSEIEVIETQQISRKIKKADIEAQIAKLQGWLDNFK